MITREERLAHLRAMREYIDAPLGEGREPLDPRDIRTGAASSKRHMEIRKLPPGRPHEISDKAAFLIGQAVKSLLND